MTRLAPSPVRPTHLRLLAALAQPETAIVSHTVSENVGETAGLAPVVDLTARIRRTDAGRTPAGPAAVGGVETGAGTGIGATVIRIDRLRPTGTAAGSDAVSWHCWICWADEPTAPDQAA